MRKKFLIVILATLLICCFAVALAGCSKDEPNTTETKYDVSIKVACQEVNEQGNLAGDILHEIIFTPDISEDFVELSYGKTYKYYVYQYSFPKRGDIWLTPYPYYSATQESFDVGVLYRDYHDEDKTKWQKVIETNEICARGEYLVQISVDSASCLSRPRSCNLF